MIEVNKFKSVTQIKMSREIDGKALNWVAAYYIDGMLVDTGCDYTSRELCDLLRQYDVKYVVNTHYHEDHIGANYLINRMFGVYIFAHSETVLLMKQTPKLYPYQEMVWGYPKIYAGAIPISRKVKTPGFSFHVLETPGHCKGHISLLEATNGWCFSGDLFVSEKPRVLRSEEDLTQIVHSMEKIITSTDKEITLFTSSGSIIENGISPLKDCIQYLRHLSNEVKHLHQEGHSITTITGMIFGCESSLKELTNGQFSSQNLIVAALDAKL